MLFDKPLQKCIGRIEFFGKTPLGRKVSGSFFHIKKQSLQIFDGKEWHTVNEIYSRKILRSTR